MLLIALGVFLSSAVFDFAAARYQRAFIANRIEHAARWGVVMCLLSTVALLALVDVSRWMVIPEALGVYVGTRIGGTHASG